MKTKTNLIMRQITDVFLFVSFFSVTLTSQGQALVKYNEANELPEAGMGVERVQGWGIPE